MAIGEAWKYGVLPAAMLMHGNADDWDVICDSHEKSMREAMSEILVASRI